MLSAAFAAFGADPISARRQFKALATAGDPRAQAAYALMLAGGKGGGSDATAAVHWYAKAADQGHPVACYALAQLILEGRGSPADPDLARQWFARAADLGDRDALFMLGSMSSDPAEAVQYWRQAAARGHSGAMTSLGRALEAGDGVEADLAAAAEAYVDAATAGDEGAMEALARILPRVREASASDPGAAWVAASFTDDLAEAERLRALAVAGGHGRACLRLAEQVRRDEGPAAVEKWLPLLETAAEAGSDEAQHEIGLACATGSGVERDPRLASDWFRAAAVWGRPASLHGLGAALLEFATTDELRDEATDALWRAAAAGDAPAMFLYAAQVVETDPVEALRWLIEAADTGHADALAVARNLAATLTPDDVRRADRATQTDGAVAEGLLTPA